MLCCVGVEEGKDREGVRARRAAYRNRAVGGDMMHHSALGMANILGQETGDDEFRADQLVSVLSRKSRNEMYEYLAQLQEFHRDRPEQARKFLMDHPQFTRGVYLMQVVLGIVGNPLGDIAPRGISHAAGYKAQGDGGHGGPDAPHTAMPPQVPPPPVDPRSRGAQNAQPNPVPMNAGPRPMVSIATRQQPQPPVPGAAANMSSDQQGRFEN